MMKNKRIDHIIKIISKHHGIFTENITIYFSNAGKMGSRKSNFKSSRRSFSGDDMNVTFTLQ